MSTIAQTHAAEHGVLYEPGDDYATIRRRVLALRAYDDRQLATLSRGAVRDMHARNNGAICQEIDQP